MRIEHFVEMDILVKISRLTGVEYEQVQVILGSTVTSNCRAMVGTRNDWHRTLPEQLSFVNAVISCCQCNRERAELAKSAEIYSALSRFRSLHDNSDIHLFVSFVRVMHSEKFDSRET